MEKDKKYNVILGLMIFFFILFVGISIAWGLGFIGIKSNVDSTTNNTENVINSDSNKLENNSSNEILEGQENSNSNIASDSKDSASINSSSTNNQPILDVTNLDGTKCLNTEGMSYEYSTFKYNHGVSVVIKDNKLFFSVNNNELGDDNIKIEKYKDYEITGINVKDIAEIYVSGWGQAVVCPAVYFLMKDGSIIWLNSEDAIANKDFVVEGKIPNVKNIVRIVNAYASAGFGGGATILGLKSDGSFYDLCIETVNKQ